MSKAIVRNVEEGEVLLSDEIFAGKVYKQRGVMSDRTSSQRVEYFLERIPGTEERMEIWNIMSGDIEEVDAAHFEIYLKQEGKWEMVSEGPLPIEKEIYDQIEHWWV